MSSENLFLLGTIKKAHGIKGEILLTAVHENIKFTNDLKQIWLGEDPSHISSWKIENLKLSNEKVFLKLRNVETPDEANFLKGLNVYINSETVEELTIYETVGFEILEDISEIFIGVITGIEKNAMQDLVVFEIDGDEKMIPAVAEYIKYIDWEGKKVYIETIEGLI